MTTPEERREAHKKAIADVLQFGGVASPIVTANAALNGLLAHFDEHEPAVAKAIRLGVVTEPDGRLRFNDE